MNRIQFLRMLPIISFFMLEGLTGCIATQTAQEIEQARIAQAARALNVEPTLNGLSEYIVKSIKPGMSRDQVEQTLGMIAPCEIIRGPLEDVGGGWGPTACDKISLKLGPLPSQVWRIFACYNRNGELVHLKSADADFPPLGISAPFRE